MSNKALAVIEDTTNLIPNTEYMNNAMEQLDGVDHIPFGSIKIPGSGGSSFEVCELGDDPDKTHPEQAIEGVVVMNHASNVYWPNGFSGGAEPPACRSEDGRTGIDAATGVVQSCVECPHNRWGSALGGQGKACKNQRVLYILRKDTEDIVPMRMALPPSSLTSFNNYRSGLVFGLRAELEGVLTKITLKKTKNSDGTAYSKAAFEATGVLPAEVRAEMKAYAKVIAQAARRAEAPELRKPVEVTADQCAPIQDEEPVPWDLP